MTNNRNIRMNVINSMYLLVKEELKEIVPVYNDMSISHNNAYSIKIEDLGDFKGFRKYKLVDGSNGVDYKDMTISLNGYCPVEVVDHDFTDNTILVNGASDTIKNYDIATMAKVGSTDYVTFDTNVFDFSRSYSVGRKSAKMQGLVLRLNIKTTDDAKKEKMETITDMIKDFIFWKYNNHLPIRFYYDVDNKDKIRGYCQVVSQITTEEVESNGDILQSRIISIPLGYPLTRVNT